MSCRTGIPPIVAGDHRRRNSVARTGYENSGAELPTISTDP